MAEVKVTQRVTPGIASQDFRDGASTAALQFASRAKQISRWGVPLSTQRMDEIAASLIEEWGGYAWLDTSESQDASTGDPE